MPATIKDIAAHTGLGLATISKYFNGGNVLEKNRALIEQAVRELDFKINEYARGLRTHKSKTIGIVIPEMDDLFITSIITAIEEELRKNGYACLVCDCGSDRRVEHESVEFLIGKMVDGIINMPICRDGSHLQSAQKANVPVVLIDRTVDGYETCFNAVLIDNVRAAESATEYLIDRGHTQIAVIAGPENVYTSEQRLIGYQRALEKRGIPLDPAAVIKGNYTVQGGYEGTKELIARRKRGCTAVFVMNYYMTLGSILALNEQRIKIPDDISVVAFDSMIFVELVSPKLTTVSQPMKQMGRCATELMLSQLAQEAERRKPETIILQSKLKKGGSVRNVRPGR